MKIHKLIVGLLFTGLILNGCGSSSSSSDSTQKSESENIQPVAKTVLVSTSIVTTSGKTIKVDRTQDGFIFNGYEGKIILLEVYGDTCPHCKAAIPSYNNIQAKYSNDVHVIALESYGTLTNANLQEYDTVPKENTGQMFPMIKDLTGYNLQAVPYLMILARDGSIVYDSVLSDFPESEIETRIEQLM